MEEDIYQDNLIPSGSLILPNIWSVTNILLNSQESLGLSAMKIRQMMRDERYFPSPDEFKPERFLKMVEETDDRLKSLNGFYPNDPSSLVFGFGRRYTLFCHSL